MFSRAIIMELTLAHQTETEINVICDDQLSHTFYLHPSMVLDTPAEVFLPPSDPVAYGKLLYQALFPPGSLVKRTLEKQPEGIVLVAKDHKLDAIPWEYTYGT